MANRLQELLVADPVLTTVMRGYTPTENFLYEQIFPFIDVEKENGKVRTFGKEYYRTYNSRRALNAESNKGKGLTSSTVPYSLNEFDLAIPIDYRERAEAVDKIEAEYAELCMRNVMLGIEQEIAEWLQDTGTYADGHSIALSGSDKFNHADSNPIAIIDEGKELVASKIGIDPNTLVLSKNSYNALRHNLHLKNLLQLGEKGIVKMEHLKEFFEIPNILIGESTVTNEDDEFVRLWENCAMLYYIAPPGARSKKDPSWGYTFRLKGFPKGDKYPDVGNKVENVRATTIQDSMILMPEAGYLITATV